MSATNINYNGLGMMIFRAGVGFGFGLPSTEHLVGYWPLNETSGTNAPDESGNGNDGTLVNMEDADWVDGVTGKCLSFDGSDEYVGATVTGLPIGNSARTVTAWFQTSSVPYDYNTVFAYGTGIRGTPIYLITLRSDGTVYSETGSGSNPLTSATSKADGVWHHVALSYTGSVETLYIDGILEDQTGSITIDTESSDFEIANMPWHGDFKFTGLIDEVRIYSTALTASEIKALYDYPGGV